MICCLTAVSDYVGEEVSKDVGDDVVDNEDVYDVDDDVEHVDVGVIVEDVGDDISDDVMIPDGTSLWQCVNKKLRAHLTSVNSVLL